MNTVNTQRRIMRLESADLAYSLRESSRVRRARITVFPGGEVVVSVPPAFPEHSLERLLKTHATWVLRAVSKLGRYAPRTALPTGKRAYRENKEKARMFAKERVAHWNTNIGVSVGRISIRDQKSRWGSCSRKGNLSFNVRIIHLPRELADYIVVHELCHVREMNHSRAFWSLVEERIPDYRRLRRELSRFSLT